MRFNEKAHCYALHADVQREMAAWLAEWLDPGLCANCRALEYGAGEGIFTHHAVGSFMELVAMDLAPRMVELGRASAPNAIWREGNAWTGVGLNHTVGFVMSSSLMQWCPDPTRVLGLWRHQLPKGARMLHGFYIDPTLQELRALQGEVASPLTWLNAEEWRNAFHNAGWAVERFEVEDRSFRYASALDFMRSLHGVGAVSRSQITGSGLRRLIREYDRLHFAEGGGVYASWTFCRVQVVS